jgi:menaquinone-dependent protoporphyrinogen IX oxidase
MKNLVLFYSRTGTTKKIGLEIAYKLDCDFEEIIDEKNRSGPLGWISAGKDAKQKNLTKLKDLKHDISEYDLVIIGTPIWSWNLSTPIRTLLTKNREKLKKTNLAFFCTMGSEGDKKAFEEMEALSKKPIATLALTSAEVSKGKFEEKLDKFLQKIKPSKK